MGTARVLLLVCSAFFASACTDSGTSTLFSPTTTDFYSLPFPNDLRRHTDGSLDLSQFPTNSPIVDGYRAAAETLDGFSLNGAMSSRFDGPLDPASLPDPAASITPAASVYLINVDPASSNRGMRTPIVASFRAEKTPTIGPNRLVVRPYPGFGLDEGTTYALVITNRVRAADGSAISAAEDFQALLHSGGGAAISHAREVYTRLLEWLDEPGDDARDDVVSASVFTTQHATYIAPAIRAGVFSAPAPVARNIVNFAQQFTFTVWHGAYDAPNFQTGDPPYTNTGGEIQIGPGGAIVQRMETMRFALTIPNGAIPSQGWPICIYQHGTGGDWQSFIDDGTARRLAAEGIAVISTDQVLHGPRDPSGTDPGVAFFNFTNFYAGRDNALQGAADAWSQMRLALGLNFSDGMAGTVHVDPNRVYFFGHSQGGLTGPGFVAFEPTLSGAVLSGTGGLLYLSMLYKTAPVDFPSLIETLTRDSPMDEDNPSLAIAQMWIERSDGANYARFMVREPQFVDGVQIAPRNIFQTEGFVDSYSPNQVIEAFATAIGGDQVATPDEKEVVGLTLRGRGVKSAPITGNLGGATAVLAQYKQAGTSDGHFVVFDIAAAQTQSSEFLGTLARTGQATVVSP